MNLIFIGDEFYTKSHSFMSSIYRVDNDGNIIERSDWGFVQVALKQGQEIHIVQANPEQMLWAYKKLASILERDIEGE